MTRACIHLGMHNYPDTDGICQETLNTIFGLIANKVSKTSTTKNSAIALVASKEFLDSFFIHNESWTKADALGQGIGGFHRQVLSFKFAKRVCP
jgi:hypothetical protein